MRTVTIIGATGSVGRSTLDLVGRRRDEFAVEALTGAGNVDALAAEARRLGARLAVTALDDRYGALRDALAGSGVEVAAGAEAVAEAAARPADWTLNGIVGAAGLGPSLAVLGRGGTLALANKETLVAAGPLVMDAARRTGAAILPVDSEHSALFQLLRGERMEAVERVTITASGGAFRDWPMDRVARATPEEAARHPNWDMGLRITVDSASMFNKALEMLEARELFGVPPDTIEVLMHPESVVHALVGFRDGATLAHLGAPDMRHAIGHALNFPSREALPVAPLDLAAVGRLHFAAPERDRHAALWLARDAMAAGGLMGAVLNAAKERALDAFLAREVGFLDMHEIVARVMAGAAGDPEMPRLCRADAIPSLDEVLAADRAARLRAAEAARAIGAARAGVRHAGGSR